MRITKGSRSGGSLTNKYDFAQAREFESEEYVNARGGGVGGGWKGGSRFG